MASDELKPCPFCGGAPKVRTPEDFDGFAIHVHCRCGAQLYGEKRHFMSADEAATTWNRRAQDFDAMRQRAEQAEIALAEVRSMFPVKLDKQAFVVNGGEPLRADGDDEFYSATKVNHALAEILQRIDAALAKQTGLESPE